MKMVNNIPVEKLREAFNYNPETGFLTRKSDGVSVGKVAKNGYIQARIFGTLLYVHRVAFAIANGRWPNGTIDHVNRVKTDNRIVNLREATHSENMRNSRPRLKSKTGFVGIIWHKIAKKYQASIKLNGKFIYLGLFASLDDALDARRLAEKKYHGEFAYNFNGNC